MYPVRGALLVFLLGAVSFCRAEVESFGVTRSGAAVDKVILENERGMRVSWIDFGATLTSIEVKGRDGVRRNVLLSLPTLAAYEANKRRYAAVIGRYAGRIGGARFELDGRTVQLPANAHGLIVHGGADGYDKRIWARTDFSDAESMGSIFRLVSPDGDQGFPGKLEISVTYRLMRRANELRIEYRATTDAPTIVNLTNHAFFNLAGAGSTGMATHRFHIFADRYAVTDDLRVPTGELARVDGTLFDLRDAHDIMERIARVPTPPGGAPGYDHPLVFNKPENKMALVADVHEACSGRRLRIYTSAPSVIFNSANGFDGSETGSEGIAYQRHDGFAFETQILPDAPNHANFAQATIRPGQVWTSETRLRFTVQPTDAAGCDNAPPAPPSPRTRRSAGAGG